MPGPKNTELPVPEMTPAERNPDSLRVHLDPSTPAIRSIVRVVVVTMLLLFVAGYVQRAINALSYLFFLIVLSVFFAYLIDPIVRLIRKPFKARNIDNWMPRSLAILLAYVIVFTILGVAVANIAPRVVDQAKEFGTNLPAYGQAIRERSSDLSLRFDRLRIPDEVQGNINEKITEVGGTITAAVGGFVLASVSYIPWFILVPILAFFFLKGVNHFRLGILRMFPAGPLRYRAEMVLIDLNTTLAAYTRAQLISCFLIAIICTIGFYALGLRYALLLGILAGIFEFVPLLGPAAIGLIVTLVAAASDNPWKALYVVIFLIVLRIAQDYIFYPRIVRGGIHLHPLTIILAVLAGEQVGGIPGVFLAIPLVAIGTVVYRHILEHRGTRSLVSGFIEEAETDAQEVV